jgi:hypothetical protein
MGWMDTWMDGWMDGCEIHNASMVAECGGEHSATERAQKEREKCSHEGFSVNAFFFARRARA